MIVDQKAEQAKCTSNDWKEQQEHGRPGNQKRPILPRNVATCGQSTLQIRLPDEAYQLLNDAMNPSCE